MKYPRLTILIVVLHSYLMAWYYVVSTTPSAERAAALCIQAQEEESLGQADRQYVAWRCGE